MTINIFRLYLFILFSVFAIGNAAAQTLGPTSIEQAEAAEAASVNSSDILLVVQPLAPVALEEDQPVSVDFRITGQKPHPDSDEAAVSNPIPDIGTIRLSGVTRMVTAENGETVAQVVITGIERDGAIVSIDGFAANWLAEDENDLVLSLSDQVELQGDRAAFVAALAELDAKDEDEEEEETLQVETNTEGSTEGASSGGESGSSSAASDYTTPEAPEEVEADPVIETRETMIGCEPRVDFALKVAIDQIKDQTYTDGTLTDDGQCYDSYHPSDKYPLEQDYSSCAVKVNLNALTATARYQWFYNNSSSSRINVAAGSESCLDDPNRTYAVVEDHEDCQIAINSTALTATPQARLIYQTNDGVQHEVRACAPSTSKPAVALTINTGLCPQPEDGQQLGVYTYTIDNAVHQVGVCSATGTIFASQTSYADCDIRVDEVLGVAFLQVKDQVTQDGKTTSESACYDSYAASDRLKLQRDYEDCSIDIKLDDRTASDFYQLFYTDPDGRRVEVGNCQADDDRSYAIFEDHEDCSIDHDEKTGFAIPQSRLAYQTRNGQKTEVRACAPSESRAPIAMTFNTASCGNPNGSVAQSAFDEQGIYEYRIDGIKHSYGDCRDTGQRIEYRNDYGSCVSKIDTETETVYRQFRLQTIVNGVKTGETTCQYSSGDSGNTELVRDYDACGVGYDFRDNKATYRFQYSYTGINDNVKRSYGECQDDTAKIYALTEDHDACEIALDDDELTATPQARLVYQTEDGTKHEARSCEASESRKAVEMTLNTNLCEQPINGEQQGVYTYSINNAVHQVGACAGTGVIFASETNYADCDIRIDKTVGFAFLQVKDQIIEDGKTTSESACYDSYAENDRLPLERDYEDCSVDVNLDNRTATDFYQLFYTKDGKRSEVDNCVSDAARTYAIVEDHEECSIDHNDKTGFAIPQSRLVYQPLNGEKIEVRACQASESREPIAMSFNLDSCGNPDGSIAQSSFDEQGIYEYRIDGIKHSYGECQDTGQKIEYKNDYDNCIAKIDTETETVYRHFRLQTIVNGTKTAETACQYSSGDSGNVPLVRDYDACPVDYDFKNNRATYRFQYSYKDISDNVQRSYGDCQDDAVKSYAIFEDHEACQIALDNDELTATPQSRLIYQTEDGTKHEARACAPSESREAVPMTLNTNLCEQPINGAEQGVYTYAVDNAVHQVGVCADTGVIFASETNYADCDIRIDKTVGFAFLQVKDQIMQDDEVTSESECYDSYTADNRLPLERDYEDCSTDIDLDDRTAIDFYQLFYTKDDKRIEVDNCVADSERSYAIVEDHEECSIEHNEKTGFAIPQSRLVYQPLNGQKIEVRACQASESREAIAMSFNLDSCDNPNGSVAQSAFDEQGIYEYRIDGIKHSYGECQDTGQRIEYKNDYDSCAAKIDTASETVYRQFRLQTIINGTKTAETACQYSSGDSGNVELARDYDACAIDYDFKNNKATYRFQYSYKDISDNVKRSYGDCQDDTAKRYAIFEDHDDCQVVIDNDDLTATPQARLVYQIEGGTTHEARACAPSESREAVPMLLNTNLCEQPINGAEQGIYTYTIDNAVHQVGACADTGVIYASETNYADCDIRVDKVLGFAFLQVKDQTFIDGKTTSESACYDSFAADDRLPLERDYADCSVDINLDERTATDFYQLFYTDTDGDRVEIDKCVADSERSYAIVEDHEECSIDHNDKTGFAIPQSRLVYQPLNGGKVEVRACAPSETRNPIAMSFNTDSCDNLNGSVAQSAFDEQGIYEYKVDGIKHSYGDCQDTGQRIEYKKAYDSCTPKIDTASETVYRQFRLQTIINGTKTAETICQHSSDDSGNVDLVRDYDACGVSYDFKKNSATYRFQYTYNGINDNIKRSYGNCQDDTAKIYALAEDHEVCEVALDNDELTATPQSRIVYQTEDGTVYEARSCAPSESRAAVPMLLNTNLCEQPINGAEQGIYTYTINNAVHQVGACADTGVIYASETNYADCDIRVDEALGFAFLQVKDQTFIDGKVASESACYDSYAASDRLPLERDYADCSTDIDLEKRTATDFYQLFYTKDSKRTLVGNCTADADRTYAIVEDHEECSIYHNDKTGFAIPQSRLVYQPLNGGKVEVRACQASESRDPIAMSFNTDSCGNPNGSSAQSSFNEQGIYEYRIGGVKHSYGECQNTGQRIEYKKAYDSCVSKIDTATETVYRQFRLQTIINGTKTAETVCQYSSDDSGNVPLTRDYDACGINYDFGNWQATYRFQYSYIDINDNVKRSYGDCRDDTAKIYALTEDHEACDIAVDFDTEKATPQSRIIYQIAGGATYEARACQDSETRAAIDLVQNTDLCSVNPSNSDGIFEEQAIWTYTLGGTVHQAGQCETTGNIFEYKSSYDDCDIRLDKVLNAAFRQVRSQTFKNSVKIAETTCHDSNKTADRYPFARSYTSCDIVIDEENTKATARYSLFYTDNQGKQHDVIDVPGGDENHCIDDADKTYVIYEDQAACSHFIDYEANKVIPQARLIYQTEDGTKHEVQSCAASASLKAVELVEQTSTCPLEHSLSKGESYQLSMHTYTFNNLTYQADSCSPNGTVYSHEKFYGDCAPIIDQDGGEVTKQYQVRITVAGEYVYVVNQCTPDSASASLPITATTDGCNDPQFWLHDIAAQTSYGRERLYYIEDGTRIYITQCIVSDATYKHDHEIVGYSYNDAQLANWPLTKVSISTGDGVYVIEESEVLAGATLIPYTLAGTNDVVVVPQERTYEGCNAFDATNEVKTYTRSDGTTYNKIIGDGAPFGPTNVCHFVLTDWYKIADRRKAYSSTSCGTYQVAVGDAHDTRNHMAYTRLTTYQGERHTVREDGITIATETATASYTTPKSCNPPAAPNYLSAQQQAAAQVAAGWK